MKGMRHLITVFMAVFLLSGCVQSDIGIRFQDQTHGQIVQSIKLTERLSSLSPSAIDQWISSLNRQVQQVHGTTQRISNQELKITIPFYNGADLEQKFNQFFNPPAPQDLKKDRKPKGDLESDLPQFSSHLDLAQNNLFFALRNHLNLELDLRSLAVLSTQNKVLIDSGNLLNLEFDLVTPWGAHILQPALNQDSVNRGSSEPSNSQPLTVTARQNGKKLIWALRPGEINQLEAIFWVPSPIGLGTLGIVLITLLGSALKYQWFRSSTTFG
ncbi:MAG: DUF3153 domain-containing protein [Microcoleaceae cyanobacterium]